MPMLSITQFQSWRYEQMAYGHNSASRWLGSQPNDKIAGGCQTSPILQISYLLHVHVCVRIHTHTSLKFLKICLNSVDCSSYISWLC